MIKNYPTQSSIDVVVSGVAEKINDVKRRVGHKKARKWLRHDANDDAIIHLWTCICNNEWPKEKKSRHWVQSV